MPETADEIVIPVRLDTGVLKRDMRDMESLSRAFARTMADGLSGAIVSGRKFSDVLKSLAASLARLTLNAALRPMFSGLSGMLGGLLASADGNVFSTGRVRAFASGGVVNGPTLFPMANGLGLMGEAGPEAIMPLARGPDGKLGVRAQGGAPVTVTMNITTQDAESFRRNRGRIAAELARAVAEGRRNL